MSALTLGWVFKNSDATGHDRLVLLALADEANDDGANCYPSIRRLAEKVRCHTKTVVESIKRLEDAGEVVVTRPERQGRGHFNRYVLTLGRAVDELPTSDGKRVTESAQMRSIKARADGAKSARQGRANPVVTDPTTETDPVDVVDMATNAERAAAARAVLRSSRARAEAGEDSPDSCASDLDATR